MNRAWSAIFPILLLPLLFHWMPLWRRNCIWFGVTVAPGYADGPDARRVLQRFRIAIWLLALAAAGMAVLGAPAEVPWALAAAVTLEIGGALAAFAHARHQTLPHAVRPSSERSASLTDAPEGMPGGIFAVLVPFAILAAAAVYLYLNWDLIPQRFPAHWDVLGAPDRWAERSWQSVLATRPRGEARRIPKAIRSMNPAWTAPSNKGARALCQLRSAQRSGAPNRSQWTGKRCGIRSQFKYR